MNAQPKPLRDVDWVVARLYGEDPKKTKRYGIYEMARRGMIPHVRLGRAIRFDVDAVEEWIRAGGTAGNGDGEAAA